MAPRFIFLRLFLPVTLFVSIAAAQIDFSQVAINSEDTSTASIAEGDFDNDGVLDLVTVNETSLSFYKGLGNATYASPINQPLPQYRGQAFAADFNRDGNLDLAIGAGPYSGIGGVTILLGNGDGTFRQGTNIPVKGNANYIALADFNGDHLPDIAVSTGEVFLGKGDGTFRRSATLPEAGNQILTGDFNADGNQDVVTIASDIVLYLGKGNGRFKPPLHSGLSASSIAVGDFYNDRVQTLVALISIYGGQGNFENDLYSLRYSQGQLLVENKYVINPESGDPFMRVIGGDLDGDFKDDIFLVGGNFMGSAVSGYMLGNGDGTFRPPQPAPYWMDLQDFPVVRDLDLDGRHDIAIAWTSIFDNIGGAEALRNTNAKVNCTPPRPDGLSVHVCAPKNGQQVGQTFTFRAAGNARSGYAKRMELWIDGKKVAQNLEDQLKAKISLTRGDHAASFVVVDSFDKHVSKPVKFSASY